MRDPVQASQLLAAIPSCFFRADCGEGAWRAGETATIRWLPMLLVRRQGKGQNASL